MEIESEIEQLLVKIKIPWFIQFYDIQFLLKVKSFLWSFFQTICRVFVTKIWAPSTLEFQSLFQYYQKGF